MGGLGKNTQSLKEQHDYDLEYIKTQKEKELEEEKEKNVDDETLKRLSRVKKVVDAHKIPLTKYAKDLQAILITPKWKCSTELTPSSQEGFADDDESKPQYKALSYADIDKQRKKDQASAGIVSSSVTKRQVSKGKS